MQHEKVVLTPGEKVFKQTLFIPWPVYRYAAYVRFHDTRKRTLRPTSTDIYYSLLITGLEFLESHKGQEWLTCDSDAHILTDQSDHNKGMSCMVDIPESVQNRAINLMASLNDIEGVHIPFLLDFYVSLMKLTLTSLYNDATE